ncbi:MAG: hypothetical protein CIT03_02450 [Methanobacterium sp.]|nr:MAG: hypothetical protein CIT03_02450 [Methanobacterium sp.]
MKIETTKEDWKKTIIYLIFYLSSIVIAAILLLPIYWYIWVLIIVSGMIILAFWHSQKALYHCTNCGNEFQISILTDLISPQGLDKDNSGKTYGWKYVKCPACGKRMKAPIIQMK